MSMKNNAVCAVCGKPYHICSDIQTSKINPWRSITDSINCYKIHLTLLDYTNGYTDALTTAQILKQKCDISNEISLLPHIRKVIDDLLQNSASVKKSEKRKLQKNKE